MILRSVVVTPAAEFEIADAAGAYEATRPGLGSRFLDELRRVRTRIELFPESCPVAHSFADGGSDGSVVVRKAVMHAFPYGVIYQIRPEAIVIIAVLPSRADPAALAASVAMRAI